MKSCLCWMGIYYFLLMKYNNPIFLGWSVKFGDIKLGGKGFHTYTGRKERKCGCEKYFEII